MSVSLITRLLGDLATPEVAELLRSNESLDATIPLQRQIVKKDAKKKKWSLIRPGLQPGRILRVGGDTEAEGAVVRDQHFWAEVDGELVEVFWEQDHWITKEGRRILIGAGIYRTSGSVDNVEKIPAMFARPEVKQFEGKIPEIAKEYEGIEGVKTAHAAGVWESTREPSLVITGIGHDGWAVDAMASKIGESAVEKQMAMAVFSENPDGKGAMYELKGVRNHEAAVATLMKHGFSGQSVVYGQNRVILLDSDGSMRQNIRSAASELKRSFSTTHGDVEFISEDDYAGKQHAYQEHLKGLGEAPEIRNHNLPEIQEAAPRLKQKRHKPKLYRLPPSYWTIGQMAIPWGATAMGETWITLSDGRHVLTGGPAAPNGTLSQHFHAAQGKWSPEREALHEKIISDMLKEHEPVEGRKPVATILGGGVASGKTTISKQVAPSDVLHVDSDAINMKIPELEGLKTSDPEHAAARVHDEATFVANELTARAIAKKLDFVYDSTSSGGATVPLARSLAKYGYDTRAAFVNVPTSVAIKRAELRATQSTNPEDRGRVVPEDIIRQSHRGAASNFMELTKLPGLAKASLYDNSGASPKLVYEKQGNSEVIHDKQRFEDYQLKARGLHEAVEGRPAGAIRKRRLRSRSFQTRSANKKAGRVLKVANQLGQRYWMGLGGGFRSQYGDYSQDQRPRLLVVLERKKFTKEEVGFEHPAKGPHFCFECKYYEKEESSCMLVAGHIEDGDWCRKWKTEKS